MLEDIKHRENDNCGTKSIEHSQSYLDAMRHLQSKLKEKDSEIKALKGQLQESDNAQKALQKQCKLIRKDFEDEKNTNTTLQAKISNFLEKENNFASIKVENDKNLRENERLNKALVRMKELVDIVCKRREDEFQNNWENADLMLKTTSEFQRVKENTLSLLNENNFLRGQGNQNYSVNDDIFSTSNMEYTNTRFQGKENLSGYNETSKNFDRRNFEKPEQKAISTDLQTGPASRSHSRNRSKKRADRLAPLNIQNFPQNCQVYGEKRGTKIKYSNCDQAESSQSKFDQRRLKNFNDKKIYTFQNDVRNSTENYDDVYGQNFDGHSDRKFQGSFSKREESVDRFKRQTPTGEEYFYLKEIIDILFSDHFELEHFDRILEIIKLASRDRIAYDTMSRNLESINDITIILRESILADSKLDQEKVEDDLRAAEW